MKTNLGLMMGIALLASVQSASAADTLPTIPHWINDETKTVYFVPRSVLSAELDYLGAGDQYDYHFTIELSYESESMKNQLNEIRSVYPGYQIQRPILEKSQETYRLTVPAIGVSTDVEVKNGPTGPWFTWETYLTKKQGEALRTQLAMGSGSLRVQGALAADVPTLTTVEKREFSQVTCETLVGDIASVGNFIQGLSNLRKTLDETRFQYASTRDAFLNSALTDCFQLQSDVTVSSFKELLDVKLQPKRRGFHPFGETKKIAPVSQVAPLFYELNIKTN